ncbi:hypothetical protein ACFQJ8_16665 [Halocatena marina]|uniref:hypothetical protein n=1 Tax=Halocatena marina TaxID=2934937 RepID=UPI003621E203
MESHVARILGSLRQFITIDPETDFASQFNAGAVGLYWLFDVFMVGNRVISQHSRIDSEEVVLTAVSARTAASGLVVAEIFRILAYLAAPTIIISGLFVYAFQTPASVVFVPLAVVLFVVSSVVVAYACGFAGAFLLSRSRIVARYKTPIGISLIVLFFGGYSVLQYAPTIDMGIDSGVLAWLPISWYGDLAVVGTAISQSWMRVGECSSPQPSSCLGAATRSSESQARSGSTPPLLRAARRNRLLERHQCIRSGIRPISMRQRGALLR